MLHNDCKLRYSIEKSNPNYRFLIIILSYCLNTIYICTVETDECSVIGPIR